MAWKEFCRAFLALFSIDLLHAVGYSLTTVEKPKSLTVSVKVEGVSRRG